MPIVRVSRSVQSDGAVWSTLAAGPLVATSITASNLTDVDACVSVRLTRSAGQSIILPEAVLPGSMGRQSTRLRLIAIPMLATDTIEVYSDAPVDWMLAGDEAVSARHVTTIGQSSADAWVTLWTGPAEVSGLLCACLSPGGARASLRVVSGATERLIYSDETLPEGGTGRITPVAVLGVGDTLQARSDGFMQYMLSGLVAA